MQGERDMYDASAMIDGDIALLNGHAANYGGDISGMSLNRGNPRDITAPVDYLPNGRPASTYANRLAPLQPSTPTEQELAASLQHIAFARVNISLLAVFSLGYDIFCLNNMSLNNRD